MNILRSLSPTRSGKVHLRAAQAVLILGLLIFTSTVWAETRIRMETTPTSHTTKIRIRSTKDNIAMLRGSWHIIANLSDGTGVLFDCTVRAKTEMTPPPQRTGLK